MKHIASSALLMAAIISGSLLSAPSDVSACSRILYQGSDSLFVVGRSLDWKPPLPTTIYVYPRGMHKKGSDKPGAVEWDSKYGAVYAVGYDGGITEGMNEKGLVINGLFCKGTVYESEATSSRPPISMSMFIGWLLDCNATVEEVEDVLRSHDFYLSGATFDGGTAYKLNCGVTYATWL